MEGSDILERPASFFGLGKEQLIWTGKGAPGRIDRHSQRPALVGLRWHVQRNAHDLHGDRR